MATSSITKNFVIYDVRILDCTAWEKFNTRQTTSKDQEPHELVQLLRLL